MPKIPAVFRVDNIKQSEASLSGVADSEGAVRSGPALMPRLYAYGIFSLFTVAYFWMYLPQGFSLIDSGYLLGLGHRVAEGQTLYSDIYFFRTPLSVYWQAGMIALFGGAYTVLASKIIWAIQITATVVIASFIYQRWLSPALLAITLCATLVYSSMLLSFPWYSYDGMFFTALFALLFCKRRYIPAGLAAGLAFMCKQSFLALIPVTFMIWLIALVISRGSIKHWRDALMWCSVGALAVILVMLGIFALQGSLGDFWQNVFVLPSSAHPLSTQFILIQNLPQVAQVAWPFTLLMATILLARATHWSTSAITAAAFVALGGSLVVLDSSLSFNITALLYVMLLVGIMKAAYTIRRDRGGRELTHKIMFYAASFAALYLAGLNYGGWRFSNIGGVLAIPAVITILASQSDAFPAGDLEKRSGIRGLLQRLPGGKSLQAAVFALATLTLAFIAHHKYPYFQPHRETLVVPFQSSMLAGLVSEAKYVDVVDGVVSYVTENTEEGDSIFAYPDFTALNFLTSRPAWGSVQWYYKLEFNLKMARETVEHLRLSPPRLAVVRSHWRWESLTKEPYSYAHLEREKIIFEALQENMTIVDSIGFFHIMRPNSDFESIPPDGASLSNAFPDTTSGDTLANATDTSIQSLRVDSADDGQ